MRKAKPKFSALSDFITSESSARWGVRSTDLLSQKDWGRISPLRFYIFYLATFLIFLIFAARLFTLTVVQGAKNRTLAEQNRVRLVEVEAPRGEILDRAGQMLSKSQIIYVLKKAGQVTEISKEQADELSRQGLASEDFAGQLGQIERKVERVYSLREAGAHVLGYTTTASVQDVAAGSIWSLVQSVGKLGVEEEYNDFLTGKAGRKLIEVDASGKKVSILGDEQPRAGRSLYLTINKDLQKFAYESLSKASDKAGTKRGAVIVSDPNNGQVLALTSYPSFDPADISKSFNEGNEPFFNRAISGTYPPGSIFKIVTAFSGLESGKIDKDTEIEDVGQFELGDSKFANWFFLKYGKTDGTIKIQKAIARSNDVFFYKVAQMVGFAQLRQTAKKFNFGQKSGIDLPGEAVGLLPDEVWKKSTYKQNWFLGDTLHMGIGQGYLLATPIQINMMTSYMASGKLIAPYVASKIDEGSGSTVNLEGKVLGQDLVSGANFNLVRAGMHDACKTGGTGAPFFNASYDVGCKTGTAEKALGNPHAWFTVFAPFEVPQISVTVLVEEGGEGSQVAAPVAREICDWWMGHRR